MSIRQFWYGRDSEGEVACFVGGYTPKELGLLKTEHEIDALSKAIVNVLDFMETHSTKCEAIRSKLERPALSVIERGLIQAQTKKQEEQCRCGLYVFDAFDRNLLFKRAFSPTVPLKVDLETAKLWSAGMVQIEVQFSTVETLNLELTNRAIQTTLVRSL